MEAIKLKLDRKDDGRTDADVKTIKEKLIGFGYQEKTVENLINKHTIEYLAANIAVVEERRKKQNIQNIQAYLMRAFQVDFSGDAIKLPVIENNKKQEKEDLEAKQKAAVEELKRQKIEFKKYRKAKTEEQLQEMKYSEVEELKRIFLEDLEKTEILRKVFIKKGFDYHSIQANRYNFLADKILPQEMNDFEFFRAANFSEVEISNS